MRNRQIIVPDGYEVHETNEIVHEKLVEIYPFKLAALSRARQLDDNRFVQTYRYEVEKIKDRKAFAKVYEVRHGRPPNFFEYWFARWAVVPYQNVLRKIEK